MKYLTINIVLLSIFTIVNCLNYRNIKSKTLFKRDTVPEQLVSIEEKFSGKFTFFYTIILMIYF